MLYVLILVVIFILIDDIATVHVPVDVVAGDWVAVIYDD
jgi:hypothetical protein